MKNLLFSTFLFLLITQSSCIDRDTIAGTGKEDPFQMIGTGGNFQTGIVSTKLATPLSVRVLSEKGRPVRNTIVEFLTPGGNIILSDTLVSTDGDGNASTKVTLGTKSDSLKVHATVLGIKGSPVIFSLYARSASESRAEIFSGNNQQITVKSQSQPLRMQVFDSFNNPVPNVNVFYTTQHGSVNPTNAKTDSLGIASSVWTLDSLAAVRTVTVQIPTIVGGTFNFTATGRALTTPASLTLLSEDTLYGLQGQTLNNAIDVRVKDQYGNNIPLVPFQFSVLQGSTELAPSSLLTNNVGSASTSITLTATDSFSVIQAGLTSGSLPPKIVTVYAYKYFQIDSLKSSGGAVELFWQNNLNPFFANFTLQRCNNFTFDNTTVTVAVITNENTTSIIDATATAGTSPYYRIKVNYTNGFFFYTNIRQITVVP